jgi:nucleoside-diphosphate-sugar epimerase
MLQGKTILVTGVSGFVGSRLAARLNEQGARVRGLVRAPSSLREIEQVPGELTHPESLQEAVRGCNIVVHSAVSYSDSFYEAAGTNVDGTRSLAQASLDEGVERFIHISTCGAYDLTGQKWVAEDTPLWEYDPTSNLVYGMTKAEAERAVRSVEQQGLPVVILRPPNILGAHPRSEFADQFALKVKEGKVRLGGDGSNTWPYVHIENFIDAALEAMVRPEALGQAYNIVDGHTTFREFASRYASWLGVALQQRPLQPPYDTFHGRFSMEKASAELGYSPKISYEQAMEETRRYLQEAGTI